MTTIDDYFGAEEAANRALRGFDHHHRAAEVEMEQAVIPEDEVDPDYAAWDTNEGRKASMNAFRGYVNRHMAKFSGNEDFAAMDKTRRARLSAGVWGITPGLMAQMLEGMGSNYSWENAQEQDAVKAGLEFARRAILSPVQEAIANLDARDTLNYVKVGNTTIDQPPYEITPEQLEAVGTNGMVKLVDMTKAQEGVTHKALRELNLYNGD